MSGIFDRPPITPGLPYTGPAPLMNPDSDAYLREGLEYLVDRWEIAAEESTQRMREAEGRMSFDSDREELAKWATLAESLSRQSWMVRVLLAGRLEDLARGTLTYPETP